MKWSQVLRERVTLTVRQHLDSEALQQVVGNAARQIRDEVIATSAASPSYTMTVDGYRDRTEDDVRLNGGRIVYIFSELAQAAGWALEECRKRSPVSSGDFRNSWVMLVNNQVWTKASSLIPADAEVWIVNVTPYARKIEVGGQKIRVDPKIVESVRGSLMRKFSTVSAERAFKAMQGGRDAAGNPVPYILKGSGVASGLSWKKKDGWSRKHKAYTSRRSDRQAGQQMLYPTLILTRKD